MLNLIKKIFNKNKEVTPDIISDRLINGVIEFIQNRKVNVNPRFTYFDKTGKNMPLYTFDSHFPEDSDIYEKLSVLNKLVRTIHLHDKLQNTMTFAYGVKDETSRIQARYVEDYEEANCVIVDMQTPDGPVYVVVDFTINGDQGEIGDREMYLGSERVFFSPGQVYSRILDDKFVFFKVLKVETHGLHILCYGNEVEGTSLSRIDQQDFHFQPSESIQEFLDELAEQMGGRDGIAEVDPDDMYDSIIGTFHLPGAHLPISWDEMDSWDISRHTFIPVEEHELNGYKRWESDSGIYF